MLNTEKFTHVRKNKGKNAKKKKNVGKKIRDIKRMLAHLESQPEKNEEMIEAQKEKLKELTKQKRTNRGGKFIDQKYKNIKFYGKFSVLKGIRFDYGEANLWIDF
jgi:DNA-binding transcriptional MerR regulator